MAYSSSCETATSSANPSRSFSRTLRARLIDLITTLALVASGLVTRTIIDAALARAADAETVALWSQYQSIADLVGAVSLVGIGQGLTVFAARQTHDSGALLRAALFWGLGLSGILALALVAALPWLGAAGVSTGLSPPVIALGAMAGWSSVAPGVFLAWWQGRRQRGRMLAVNLLLTAPLLAVAAGWGGAVDATRLLLAQTLTQLAIFAVLAWTHRSTLFDGRHWRGTGLPRYLLPGLTIGLLSPLSLIWLRAELAQHLSWAQVAQLQALWRLNEWIYSLAASLLFLVWLPRLSICESAAARADEMRRMRLRIVLPAGLLLALVALTYPWLIGTVYGPQYVMPRDAAALVCLGDALRVASWVPLVALFALGRSRAIVAGEWLSLPLLAVLVTVVPADSLWLLGILHVASYSVYLAFNHWVVQARGAAGETRSSAA